MKTLDRNQIRRLLGIAIYSRALDYHRSGRVLRFALRGRLLQGRVRGSEGNEYDVLVELDGEGGLEEARCGCPYPDLCKHIGALLLRALEEGEQSGGVEVEEGEEILPLPAEPARPARQGRGGGAASPGGASRASRAGGSRTRQTAGPKSAVAGAQAPEGGERFRLAFVVQESLPGLDPSARRRWLLSAALRFLRQDGSYGRWQDFRPALNTEPATDEERTLLAYLLHREQYRDYLDPYLELLASGPQLPLFLRAGRETRPLRVVEIQAAVACFRLSALGSTSAGTLDGQEPLFLPEVEVRGALSVTLHPPVASFQRGPLLYLIEETEGLLFYRKNDPQLQRLLPPLLARAQPRPLSAIRELQTQASRLPGSAFHVHFTARRVRLLRRRPAAVLEIEEHGDGLGLRLLFSYEGRLLPFPAREQLIALQGTEEEYVALRRAEAFENDRFLLLSALLQDDRGSCSALTTGVSGEQEASLFVRQGLAEFLLEHGQKLLEAGFELRRRGRRIRHVRSLNFVAHSSQDWLDLEVEAVGEGGERLALDPRLLDGPFLNRGEATYLLSREDIARLQELARQGELKGGRYRLSRYHYGLIDSLYEQIANRDEGTLLRIRRVMEGLRSGALDPVEPPEGFAGTLRDYQRAGLGWLWFLCRHEVNGCLADDMGLGKTVQTLALLQKLKGEGRLERALIVAPVSTLANWEQEVRRFTPGLAVTLHHGAGRARAPAHLRGPDILLTSYHTLRQDLELLRTLRFTYVILDEAQTIKNPLSCCASP
jgi:hypothetical protein